MGDSTRVMQHRSGQSYSFRIMTDDNDHPVPPDSVTIMERKTPVIGTRERYKVWCMGGCIMVGTQLCLLNGCTPMDNACGCIPPVCGVCSDWGCTSIVSGFVSGGLVDEVDIIYDSHWVVSTALNDRVSPLYFT
jgi:hypothetical protein